MTDFVTMDFNPGDPEQLDRNASMCVALGQPFVVVRLTPAQLRMQANLLRAAERFVSGDIKASRLAVARQRSADEWQAWLWARVLVLLLAVQIDAVLRFYVGLLLGWG